MDKNQKREPDPELRKLYPHFTDEKLIEAEDNLNQYVKLVLTICERIEQNPNRDEIFKEIHKEAE